MTSLHRSIVVLALSTCPALGTLAAENGAGAMMTGDFGNRGALTSIRRGAGADTFTVVLKREFKTCSGGVDGPGRAITPYAMTMSVFSPEDQTTCTVDITYAPGYGSISIRESSACLTWHGMACNFEGNFKRTGRPKS